jgi:hypothetical protein
MTAPKPEKSASSLKQHCSQLDGASEPPWPGESNAPKIDGNRPRPKKLLQNNHSKDTNPRQTDNTTSANGALVVPLTESIKQHKMKLLENANNKSALVDDFDSTPPQDTDMTEPASDDEDHPIRLSKNKKKRKLINQYALLSDDDDDEDDDNATLPPLTNPASPNPNSPPPKQGILNVVSPKFKGRLSVTFATDCNQEQSEWRTLKKLSPHLLQNPATLRQNKYQRSMEQQLASLERDTGIDNVVYGASLTRLRKTKSSTTSPKQSHNSKPKTQISLHTFIKKTKPKTHPHRKLFVSSAEDNTSHDQWLNDTTDDTISATPPTTTPPDPPNKRLPINETQVPPPPANDIVQTQGNTPHNSPDCNPPTPTQLAHSQILPPTTPSPGMAGDLTNSRNTHNCPDDASLPATDRPQHHDTTTKPNSPPRPTEGNNNNTNTCQQTTTNAPRPTPLASTTLTNCTSPAPTPTPPPHHGPTPMDFTTHSDATPLSTQQTPTPTNTSAQKKQESNTGPHPNQKPNTSPDPHNVIMEDTTTPTNNPTTPMETDPHESEDDTDTGTDNKNDNTFDDLSDPEHSSGNDSDTEKPNNKTTYKLQGPARVQRKIDTRERRARNNARRSTAKNGDASPPQPNHKSYRIQIKFGTINKQEKHTVNAMHHVAEFIKHWNMIDENAELTNIKGDNPRWSYKQGTHPANPTQVKNCIHAFYSKDHTGNIILNTTIELTSTTDFWTAQKKMADITDYTKRNKIGVHLIAGDMLQEVSVGMITETSNLLRHNRDNICEEIRGICSIAPHIPLGIHEFRRKQRYGSPGHNYQVEFTCLALYTDKEHVAEVKELCNTHIQEEPRNRLFLPQHSTIIPCYPTPEIPAEIHERLIIKHNKCLDTLTQQSVTGMTWHQAERKTLISPHSKFATAFPSLHTVSAIELMGMIIKKQNNPIHSISKVGTDVVLNFDKQSHKQAHDFISTFKQTTLSTVFLHDEYLTLFPDQSPLGLQPLSYRGSTGPRTPLSQRTTAASTKHAEHLRSLAAQEPYTMPADIPQIPRAPKPKTGNISYATATAGHNRNRPTARRTPPAPQPRPPQQPHTIETDHPTSTTAALEERIRTHVDSQIDTLQSTMAEQLAGPLMSTVKNVVNEELLSNNAYAAALSAHFSTFDHAKFALIPAEWKPDIDMQIEQTNVRMDRANDRITEQERQTIATATCAHDSLSNSSYSKSYIKTHDASITSLQAELNTQNITVTNLASNLEAALAKIASLELQLKTPLIIEYDRNIDDKISELSSLLDEKLKPVLRQQTISTEICYVNNMTGNRNNKIITDHCNSTGQDLPKLGMYAVDVTTIDSVRANYIAARPSHTTGHPGGQDDGASQSAPPV